MDLVRLMISRIPRLGMSDNLSRSGIRRATVMLSEVMKSSDFEVRGAVYM